MVLKGKKGGRKKQLRLRTERTMASPPGPVPAYQTVAATANRNGVKMASNCRSTKKSSPIAIATDRTAMPYRRIVGIGVGEEGSRFAMLASFVSQPTNKAQCAKVGDGMRG